VGRWMGHVRPRRICISHRTDGQEPGHDVGPDLRNRCVGFIRGDAGGALRLQLLPAQSHEDRNNPGG